MTHYPPPSALAWQLLIASIKRYHIRPLTAISSGMSGKNWLYHTFD